MCNCWIKWQFCLMCVYACVHMCLYMYVCAHVFAYAVKCGGHKFLLGVFLYFIYF